MRQPGNEFKIDPFQAIGTAEIPAPTLPASLLKDHQRWATNAFLARQHGFCGKVCVSLSAATLSKDEESCLHTCFSKYSVAMNTLQEEKAHFASTLEDLALRGEDKFAARGI